MTISSSKANALGMLKTPVIAALYVAISACAPPRIMVYDPADWQFLANEETGWFDHCLGVEIRTYRTTIGDEHQQFFRQEFEILNTTASDVELAAATILRTGGKDYSGEMVRLYSPQGQLVGAGDYAEFAAIFELEYSASAALDQRIEIQFAVGNSALDRESCVLRLVRPIWRDLDQQ